MPEKAEAENFFDAKTNAWSNKLAKQVSFIHDGFEVLNRKEALDFWRKKGLTQYEAFAVFFWTSNLYLRNSQFFWIPRTFEVKKSTC